MLAAANRHDSPLLAATLDKLDDLGPLPGDIRVHLDAGYDSQKTRDELAARGMTVAIQVVRAGYWPGWSAGGSHGVPLKRLRRASMGSMCHLAAVER